MAYPSLGVETFNPGAVLPSTSMNGLRDAFRAIMEADSIGTTLPPAPVHGQLFWYVADPAKRIVWTLKFNAGGAAGKQWEFVGGDALEAIVELAEPISASAVYVPFTTVVQLTVPLAGEYWVSFGAGRWDGAFTGLHYLAPKFGAAATTDADAAITSLGAGFSFSAYRQTSVRTLLALDLIQLQYRQATASGGEQVSGKFLRVQPRRVG